MFLAEALLRTPDAVTRDRLIAEQVATADWARHLGESKSLLVNAATWALMLAGRLLEPDAEARENPGAVLHRLGGRLGEPVLRAAVATALRIMGEQFVLEGGSRRVDTATWEQRCTLYCEWYAGH